MDDIQHTCFCVRHSADDSAVEDRHAEQRHHDLHKVAVAQHSRRPLDHVPRRCMALQPRAQHRLRDEQTIVGMDGKHAVDGRCGLQYVIVWDIHHVVAVLVLILPGC